MLAHRIYLILHGYYEAVFFITFFPVFFITFFPLVNVVCLLLLPGATFFLLAFGGKVVLFPTFLALLSICRALILGFFMSPAAESALDVRGSIPWLRISLGFFSSLEHVDFFLPRGLISCTTCGITCISPNKDDSLQPPHILFVSRRICSQMSLTCTWRDCN